KLKAIVYICKIQYDFNGSSIEYYRRASKALEFLIKRDSKNNVQDKIVCPHIKIADFEKSNPAQLFISDFAQIKYFTSLSRVPKLFIFLTVDYFFARSVSGCKKFRKTRLRIRSPPP
ncbi:MAG TPA: hypothetical protein VHB20_16870, partial [Verrucomicrobiae bacterium]|nr:hypothetical protein [Verrucomicrobiae bacterium]